MFKKTALQVGQVLVARILLRGAMFLTTILLARALSPTQFGFYGYSMSLMVVLSQVGHLGMRQSAAFGIGQSELTRERVEWTLALGATLTGLIGAVVIWFAVDGLVVDFEAKLLACAALLPMTWLVVFQGVFLGEGRIGELSTSDVLPRAITLAGIAMFLAVGVLTLDIAFLLVFLGYSVGVGYIIYRLRRNFARKPWPDFRGLGYMVRKGVLYALPYGLQLAIGVVGVVLVNELMSLDEAGWYFGAMKLVEVVAELAITTGTVLFSVGVREDNNGDSRVALKLMRLTTVAIVGGALVFALLAEPILRLLLGADFVVAADALRILLAGIVFASVSKNLHMYISARGYPQMSLLIFAPLLPLTALLSWVLIPPLGLEGAALATLAAQAVGTVAFLAVARAKLGVRPLDAIWIGPAEWAQYARAGWARTPWARARRRAALAAAASNQGGSYVGD